MTLMRENTFALGVLASKAKDAGKVPARPSRIEKLAKMLADKGLGVDGIKRAVLIIGDSPRLEYLTDNDAKTILLVQFQVTS